MKSMLPPSRAVRLADKYNVSLNGDNHSTVVHIHDEGMKFMLRMIAEKQLIAGAEIVNSLNTKRHEESSEKAYEKIKSRFSDDDLSAIQEYTEILSDYYNSEGRDCFISGFIEGFNYLMHEVTHNQGYLIDMLSE